MVAASTPFCTASRPAVSPSKPTTATGWSRVATFTAPSATLKPLSLFHLGDGADLALDHRDLALAAGDLAHVVA